MHGRARASLTVVGLLALAVWTVRTSAAQEVTVPSTSVETTTATTAPETTATSRPPAATTLATPPPTRTATTTRRRATTTTTTPTTAPTTTIFVIPGRPADEGSPPPTTNPLTPARPPSGDLPGWATALFWIGVGGAAAIMAGTWARNRRRLAERR